MPLAHQRGAWGPCPPVPTRPLNHRPAAARPSQAPGVRCTAAGQAAEPPGSSRRDEQPPPPQQQQQQLVGPFARRPLPVSYERTSACRRCAGCGTVACQQCGGSGLLAKGGYQKRNPVSAARVIGSKWTAMERTFGWRHFRCLQKRGKGREAFVLLAATCDESTQFWVNMQNLKDRERWASGWLQKQEILALEAQRDGGAAAGGPCKACAATGRLPCPLCSLAGQVVEL